jgi:phosphoribosylamine---glycine ligase
MKVLIYDNTGEGRGLDLALRAQDADHEVRYWLPPWPTGEPRPFGRGMVEKPKDWRPSMDWAELIVLTWNADHVSELAEYFGKGYPIFGTNARATELETDRELGQKVLADAGVKTAPYLIASSPEEAIQFVLDTKKAYAMKPWGGASDKSMTYVASTPDDAIFTISRWKHEGNWKGQLMLQEKIEGVEIGISGMFGPSGWCRALEESFEHKKFMNGDLGENTGEMGTVIRHVLRSKLFDQVLEPIGDYLHQVNYVGDCAVNCIVTKDGRALPLEFTMRLGWPDHCIRQCVMRCDPVEWMANLLNGQDSFVMSPEVAVGVCLTHGDFPRGGDARAKDPIGTWEGYPIYGVHEKITKNIHWQQAAEGKIPLILGGKIEESLMLITAGNYPLVVTGCGKSVASAAAAAYAVAGEIKIPSNLMYRTDIGDKLKDELPILQKHGFARGMSYG